MKSLTQLINRIRGKSDEESEKGAVGWALLWLLGVPIPILVVLFIMRGCT